MKYKNYLANLEARKAAWSRMGAADQKAHTKPGSQKK